MLWGSEYSTLGPLGQRFRRSRVPGSVSIRSHYGPNSDTGLCEVKARGEFSVFPTPCYSAPLGPRLAGLFREMRLHSRRQLFANAVMARLIALVIVATALAACAGHVADWSLLLSRVTSSSIFCL
jgi:hypothetical protein